MQALRGPALWIPSEHLTQALSLLTSFTVVSALSIASLILIQKKKEKERKKARKQNENKKQKNKKQKQLTGILLQSNTQNLSYPERVYCSCNWKWKFDFFHLIKIHVQLTWLNTLIIFKQLGFLTSWINMKSMCDAECSTCIVYSVQCTQDTIHEILLA